MSPDLTARFTPVLRSHEKKLKITFTISTLSLHCDPPTFDIAARAPEERWMFICRKYLGESTMYLSILTVAEVSARPSSSCASHRRFSVVKLPSNYLASVGYIRCHLSCAAICLYHRVVYVPSWAAHRTDFLDSTAIVSSSFASPP